MDHHQPVPRIRTPCSLRRHSVADSAELEEGEGAEAVVIGIREEAGTSMTSEIVTRRGVGLRKADGDGNRKTGTAGTAGIRTQLEISAMIEMLGTESARVFVQNPIESLTNLPRQRTSPLHPLHLRHPLLDRSQAANRRPRISSPSPVSLPQPAPGR